MPGIQSFRDFRARPFLKEQLMRPVKTGRIVHAQLFAGPGGVGKKTAALLLSRAINCASSLDKPCNLCPSCLQFLSGNSPRLILIEPKKNQIKVETIRELIEKVHMRTDEGKLCVIIDEAEKMNENAQNALLKTLEEAPDYVVFFLISEKPGVLLPTIRSRCAMFRFAPLSDGDVKQVLEENGIDEIRAKEASKISDGSIGLAFERLTDESFRMLSERALSALASVKKASDVAGAFQKIQADKDHWTDILKIYEKLAGELMKINAGNSDEIDSQTQVFIKNKIDGAKLLMSVIDARKKLNSNVLYQSAMEILFFDIVNQEDNR